MLLTRRNTSVPWSVTYIARQTCQVSAAFNLCLQSLDSGSTLTFTLRKNWIFDIYLLLANVTWGLHKRLKRSSQNWTTAESSHCCIINGLTSTVCVETNHMLLSWNSELGRSDHTATFMGSEALALNIVRVGLESSDAVKCICRLLGQCFGVLVE